MVREAEIGDTNDGWLQSYPLYISSRDVLRILCQVDRKFPSGKLALYKVQFACLTHNIKGLFGLVDWAQNGGLVRNNDLPQSLARSDKRLNSAICSYPDFFFLEGQVCQV